MQQFYDRGSALYVRYMCVECVLMHAKSLSFAVHEKRARIEEGVDLSLICIPCCMRVSVCLCVYELARLCALGHMCVSRMTPKVMLESMVKSSVCKLNEEKFT